MKKKEDSDLEKVIKQEEIKEIAKEIEKSDSEIKEIKNLPDFKQLSFSSSFKAPVLEKSVTTFEASNFEETANFSPSFFSTKKEKSSETKYEEIKEDYESSIKQKRKFPDENTFLRVKTTPLLEVTSKRNLTTFEPKQISNFNPELRQLEKSSSNEDYLVSLGNSEREDFNLPFQTQRKYKGKVI